MIKTWIATCGLAVCLMAQPVMAGPIEDADAGVQRGDYTTALDLYRPLAEQRNAEGQPMLGTIYDNDWGVPKGAAATALDLYRPLAEQRNAEAQAYARYHVRQWLGRAVGRCRGREWLEANPHRSAGHREQALIHLNAQSGAEVQEVPCVESGNRPMRQSFSLATIILLLGSEPGHANALQVPQPPAANVADAIMLPPGDANGVRVAWGCGEPGDIIFDCLHGDDGYFGNWPHVRYHHRDRRLHVQWCKARYKTYNPRTDTFIGKGRKKYRCNSPYDGRR
jgi:hypothetical protein